MEGNYKFENGKVILTNGVTDGGEVEGKEAKMMNYVRENLMGMDAVFKGPYGRKQVLNQIL